MCVESGVVGFAVVGADDDGRAVAVELDGVVDGYTGGEAEE